MPEIRGILEIIYFISGPALVVIAYLALSQIKVAKQQIEAQRETTRISAKRDSLRVTSEQVAKYGSEIIPLQSALFKKIKSEEVNYFAKSKVTIADNKLSTTPCADKKEIEKLGLITQEFVSTMNSMEGFSVYFTSGVADEEIAFRSISVTFCDSISKLLPLLIPMTDGENRFTSTMKLFMIWHTRLQKEDMEKQKANLEEKLKSQNIQTIRPFGSDA